MITRRSFLKSLLTFAVVFLTGRWGESRMLAQSNKSKKAAGNKIRHTKEGIEIRAPGEIRLSSVSDNITVDLRISRSILEKIEMHPAKALLLCAIEAKTQRPYCGSLAGNLDLDKVKLTKTKDMVICSFKADPVKMLKLPQTESFYYVHASWLQYCSQAIALRVKL